MPSDDPLTLLDPTAPEEARFDPDGDVARGVLSAAIARGTEPAGARASTPRRARPRLFAGVVGTSVAALVAAVAFVGGSSTLSATDALAQAVSRTAGFDSGVVRYHSEGSTPAGYRLDVTQEVRFAGGDVELVQRGEETLPSGTQERSDISYRDVAGRHWMRNDGQKGPWRLLEAAASPRDTLAERTRAEVGNRALVELVRTASDVRQDGSTFRATLDGAAVRALPTVPFDLDRAPAAAQIDIEIAVAEDGTVARVSVRSPGITRTVEYTELGAPQNITEPQR